MSVVPRPKGGARQRWKTIRYALDDTGKTVRLCVIILTASVASVVASAVPFLIFVLVHGWLG
jgi:hypothetical protein